MSRLTPSATRLLRARSPLSLLLILAVVGSGFIAWLPTEADARGFRRSRFRSSRRSWSSSRRRSTYRPRTRRKARTRSRTRSRSRSRPSRKRTTTRSTRRTRSNSAARSRRSRQAARYRPRSHRSPLSRRSRPHAYRQARRARSAYRQARNLGLAFATYSLARSHFQTTHAARYPTAFSVRPTTRPAYIPKTTLVGGVATPVRWSNSLHRYGVRKNGHMAPYQLWSDRAATSGLMTSAGYFWGPKPKSASGGWGLFIGLAIGGVIFFVLIFIGFLVLRAIRKSLTGGGPKKVTASKRQPILPPPGLRHDEPMHPDYWMQLAIGDFVVIHDFQAFEDALDGPKGVRYGDDFRIKSLIRLRGAAAGSWDGVLAELEQMGLQSLWLLAWRQGGQTQLSVYYAPTGFEPGTRTALLDRDETWPFQEPTSDDWRPGELAYNHEVTHVGTGADGAETEQRFVQLPGGPAAAGSSSEPGAANLQAATVVRWRCADAPHNPLMLLLEQGASADMAGGHLRLWLGTPVDSHEVGVTPVSVRS